MKKMRILSLIFMSSSFIFLNIFSIQQPKTKIKKIDAKYNQINHKYDSERKIVEAKRLVKNAINHFKKTSLATAVNDFIYTPMWRKGELFVFVITESGDVLAHGDNFDLIWKNISKIKTYGDGLLINEMLAVKPEGSEIGYLWNNAYKSAFVTTVVKDGVKYILGTGFYPQDSEYTVKTLVTSAARYFYKYGKDKLFEMVNNPYGPFVKGDIYLMVIDLEGNSYADGDNEANVGQNLIDYVDTKGKKLIREIINLAKSKGQGWIDYEYYEAQKRDYIEKVTDKETSKEYIIAGGYYPGSSLQAVKNLVKKAVSHLKIAGSKEAFRDFNTPTQESPFYYGSLGVFAFNLDGIVKANSYDPFFIGQNWANRKDANRKLYVKQMIERAVKYGNAIVTYYDLNSNLVSYVELVDTVDGKFIVGSRYRPDSKDQSTKVLVNKAKNFLHTNDNEKAFSAFSNPKDGFYQGDIYIFVYDTAGNRLVNGTNKNQIWQNFIKSLDQDGKSIVKELIDVGASGGGWINYRIRNATRKIYVKPVTKPNKLGKLETFIVGSGYFL